MGFRDLSSDNDWLGKLRSDFESDLKPTIRKQALWRSVVQYAVRLIESTQEYAAEALYGIHDPEGFMTIMRHIGHEVSNLSEDDDELIVIWSMTNNWYAKGLDVLLSHTEEDRREALLSIGLMGYGAFYSRLELPSHG